MLLSSHDTFKEKYENDAKTILIKEYSINRDNAKKLFITLKLKFNTAGNLLYALQTKNNKTVLYIYIYQNNVLTKVNVFNPANNELVEEFLFEYDNKNRIINEYEAHYNVYYEKDINYKYLPDKTITIITSTDIEENLTITTYMDKNNNVINEKAEKPDGEIIWEENYSLIHQVVNKTINSTDENLENNEAYYVGKFIKTDKFNNWTLLHKYRNSNTENLVYIIEREIIYYNE